MINYDGHFDGYVPAGDSPTLEQVATLARRIVLAAVTDLGSDLAGSSVIDLCCDQLPTRISTADIKAALVIAGLDHTLSRRLVLSYSRNF